MPVADDENALALADVAETGARPQALAEYGAETATFALLAVRATAEPFSAGLACYGLAAI